MKKESYFASRSSRGWPKPAEIADYFLAPPGQRWFFETRNDGAVLYADEGERLEDRMHLELMMWGHPELGVLLIWSKWERGHGETFSSKGDLTRLREWVRSTHDTPLPVGLFIPFEEAWKAVKEFIEAEGALPQSIEWIANRDLPPNTFPDP